MKQQRQAPKMTISTEDSPIRDALLRTKQEIDERLDQYNPGEQLSWWVAQDAFTVPETTIEMLKRAGPALSDFFRVANGILAKQSWVLDRLEKKFSPNYARLNRVQPDAIPYLIRPDVIPDANWHPKLIELEITVGARADTAIMAEQYGLDPDKGLVRAYVNFLRRKGWIDSTIALVTAPHPFFQDLPDDARAFATMLRREGANIVVLTGDNLSHLRFDGQRLLLNQWDGPPIEIQHIDRFIDIYEIAELEHPGMGALLDAYLAGAITDMNTCKQALDEKDWMSLFWDHKLSDVWKNELGEETDTLLRDLIPRTYLIERDARITLPSSDSIDLFKLGTLAPEERSFVVKESGTSTTASGAQSFSVLSEMEGDEVNELLRTLAEGDVPHVIQETVESPRITFTAIDPEDDRIITSEDARVKMSVFYVGGEMADIRFVSSNTKLAVNDENCVIGVVRY